MIIIINKNLKKRKDNYKQEKVDGWCRPIEEGPQPKHTHFKEKAYYLMAQIIYIQSVQRSCQILEIA